MIGPAWATNPDSPIIVATSQAARTATLLTAPLRQASIVVAISIYFVLLQIGKSIVVT